MNFYCRTIDLECSMCAGLVGATMATPADVIKTRVMNQPTDEQGRYNYRFIILFDKVYRQRRGKVERYIEFYLYFEQESLLQVFSWLLYENSATRGFLGSVQRVLAHMDPNGSLVADILAQLRANPQSHGYRSLLARYRQRSRVLFELIIVNVLPCTLKWHFFSAACVDLYLVITKTHVL